MHRDPEERELPVCRRPSFPKSRVGESRTCLKEEQAKLGVHLSAPVCFTDHVLAGELCIVISRSLKRQSSYTGGCLVIVVCMSSAWCTLDDLSN